MAHRQLDRSEFWRRIPSYADVDAEQFLDYRWQSTHSITKVGKLVDLVAEIAPADFIDDLQMGFEHAPMALRLSPYILSLINWEEPFTDPIRLQFIPVWSHRVEDHPKLNFDSLEEQRDSPAPGLTHRYPDKACFLAVDRCPVYCAYCTRNYAVGTDTAQVDKVTLTPSRTRWAQMFEYAASRPELEDIVISGGDSYNLRPDHIRLIGHTLLDIPNIRRLRFATKGPAVAPMRLLSDQPWVDALTEVVERGRKLRKQVFLHTHFNHPREITDFTRQALGVLFDRGITVRNQSVLLHGVNDDTETMRLLIKRLGYINVEPYYVYLHDLVKGAEGLRTSLAAGLLIEKEVRGYTAGFNTPLFVVDTPCGGGKRDVHSFEHYDRETGISVYRSPNIDPDALYFYFDPIHFLPESGQRRWADPRQHDAMVKEARAAAERAGRTPVPSLPGAVRNENRPARE